MTVKDQNEKNLPTEEMTKTDRRSFLRNVGMGLATLAVTATVSKAAEKNTGKQPEKPAAPLPEPQRFERGSHLEIMRRDLQRALKKPINQRHWIMAIDLEKCIGCKACTVSCVAENNLPPGVVYRPVTEEEVGEFPNVRKVFIPRPCMQCDNPPCVPVCPVEATYKRPDGVVAVDYDVCMGCRYCLAACPYNARTSDVGEFYGEGTPAIMDYESRPNFEYGKEWKRIPGKHDSPMGNARKCHFCLHRVENGILPGCVTTCLGGATYFGDKNDPDALINRVTASPRIMRLKEEKGTDPQVIYLR